MEGGSLSVICPRVPDLQAYPCNNAMAPLVRQKRPTLHEKQGKRRKADVRYRVVHLWIRAPPCICKTSASPPTATPISPYLHKTQFYTQENTYLGSSVI